MARKTRVVVVCDRHRGGDVEAVATVEIVVNGERQRIDVCSEHLAEFRKLVRPWTGAKATKGRTAKASSGRRSGRPRRRPAAEVAALREWAKKNGYELSDRGRVPTAVREAYEAATG